MASRTDSQAPVPDVDLLEVVQYRLALGRRTRQPAGEVLDWIAQDMRQLKLEKRIRYESLSAAVAAFVRWLNERT